MGINSYGEPWHVNLDQHAPYEKVIDYLESELERIDRALSHASDIIKYDAGIEQDMGFRHSLECTKRLHGSSLAGCLKVRWTNGQRSWYDDCCIGEYREPTSDKIKVLRMIQDLYNSDRLLSQMYPPESIKHHLPNETKEVTNV